MAFDIALATDEELAARMRVVRADLQSAQTEVRAASGLRAAQLAATLTALRREMGELRDELDRAHVVG